MFSKGFRSTKACNPPCRIRGPLHPVAHDFGIDHEMLLKASPRHDRDIDAGGCDEDTLSV